MAPFQHILAHIRDLASDHVSTFGLDATTPVNVLHLAAALSIIVIFVPCWEEPTFAAVAIRSRVVVNSLLKTAESNYSIAHEIGHIVQDHRAPRRAYLEAMADTYARAVLLPVRIVVQQIHDYGDDPMFLAGLNGVPVGPMRLRLQELGALYAAEHHREYGV